MSPNPNLVPIADPSLLLGGWRDDKRLLRVIASLGGVDFAAFCRVVTVNPDSFALVVGNDVRDMIGFMTEGWRFAFTDAPPADNELLGMDIESAILGTHPASGRTLFIFLIV